jgi:hypothetical protein
MVFCYRTCREPHRSLRTDELGEFLSILEYELEQGQEICAVWIEFQHGLLAVERSECQPLLSLLCSSTTLREVVIMRDPQEVAVTGGRSISLDTAPLLAWIVRALLDRPPTLPGLYKLAVNSIDLTAEEFACLLEFCRPESFRFTYAKILTSPAFPTSIAALDHVTSALQGTSTTMKSIHVSATEDNDPCLRAMLRGLENHEKLIITIWGTFDRIPVKLSRDNANAVIEFLNRSTGKYKGLGLYGFRWHGDAVFAGIATAFRKPSSYYELLFEFCSFDAESSRSLCSIFSSTRNEKEIEDEKGIKVVKGIKVGKEVVFSPQVRVLETLADSSPNLVELGLFTECQLIDLKGVFRGLAKFTSRLTSLCLPSLPVNQLNVLIQALPTFTNLVRLVFQSVRLPLHFKRRLFVALKQNGSLIETKVKTMDKFDSLEIATMKAYHNRNKYWDMALDSAIENKVADEEYGPCEFDFSSVPMLLRATVAMTVLGPGRILNVLIRCNDQIGPHDSSAGERK